MRTRTYTRAALVLLGLSLPAAACVPGYRYTSAPPLPMAEVEYGFPVKTALSNPRVAYIDQGSGPKTLLLVHGLAANAGFWRYNIPELARHYRVIAVDLPGYGRSQKDAAYPYTLAFHTETLSRLIRELNLTNVVAVGHSMGGQISMWLALRHPEQVQQLVLLAPAGFESFNRGEGEWLRNALTVKSIREASEESIRRNLAMNFYSWNSRWEWMVEERARTAKDPQFPQFGYAVVKSVGAMLDAPTAPLLGRIAQPALIVYGEYDGLIPNPYLHPGRVRNVMQAGAKAMPNARLVEVDDAGHMLMIEKPAEVNRAVLEFLGR